MEDLQRLSRRQVDALLAVGRSQTPERGAPLNAIASRLEVSAPSALDHLTALENLGLIARRRGKSRLTERGLSCVREYERHHRVAENLFHRLGFSPKKTHDAALEVDLALSHQTVERLCEAEGHPSECPHGEPIAPCDDRRAP